MGRGQSGMPEIGSGHFNSMGEWCEALCDPRYTRERSSSDYVRSHEQVKEDTIRDASLDEGISFREKI